MNKREEFLQVALTWIDVPWCKVGSTRQGVNCLGLPVGVARELGGYEELVELGEKMAMFPRPLTPHMMVDGMKGHMKTIRVRDALPGHLLLFRVTDRPDHIAILSNLSPMMIIHSDREKRKVTNVLFPAGWHPTMAFSVEDFS